MSSQFDTTDERFQQAPTKNTKFNNYAKHMCSNTEHLEQTDCYISTFRHSSYANGRFKISKHRSKR